jgi:hypothetical protein
MLQRLEDAPDGVIAIEASGTVTADDYHQILDPALDEAASAGRPIRLLYVLGADFHGYTFGAAFADAGESRRMGDIERMAVVTDVGWVRDAIGLFRLAMPSRLRVFSLAERAAATSWVGEG